MTMERRERELSYCMENSTGDTKSAYELVLKDLRWKITTRVGHLWYFMCGSETQNPFKPNPLTSE